MSRTIRNSRRSAATSFSRIEFTVSRRAAAAGSLWLAMALALCLSSGLPLVCRWLIAALVAVSVGATLWRFVLLRGPRSLRALEWRGEGIPAYFVCLGSAGTRLPAIPEECRRYGISLWLLRFRTRTGVVSLLVDAGRQDPHAIRRLGRRLFDAGVPNEVVPGSGSPGT